MLDLLNLLPDDDDEDGKPSRRERLGSAVDVSGKKVPRNVRVILNSGIEVQCDVRYDGLAEDDPRIRRYIIMGEVDWSRFWVKTIIIGELPADVRCSLLLPEITSATEHLAYRHQMTKTIVEKFV